LLYENSFGFNLEDFPTILFDDYYNYCPCMTPPLLSLEPNPVS
jgi:hypothetical protein